MGREELPLTSLPWPSVSSYRHSGPPPSLPALVLLPAHSLYSSRSQICCEPSDIWHPFAESDKPGKL